MKLVVVDKSRTAYENLAINHACFDAVNCGDFESIVRVYPFSRPGAILSFNEDLWDVRGGVFGKIDVTRRPTGGSVIYVDGDTLGYSVFLKTNSKVDVTRLYREFTGRVVRALNSFGLDVSVSNWYVRLNGGVIAGHAQVNRGSASEFQGIVRLKKWDMDALERALRLRTLGKYDGAHYLIVDDAVYDLKGNKRSISVNKVRRLRDERSELASAPGLDGFGVRAPDLAERLAGCLSGSDERHELPGSIMSRAKSWLSHYMNPDLVLKPGVTTKSCLGHCFVDLVESEQ
ncbi:hypothetical protein KY319_04560 [Candidatus Woesearchaeota archaeon]|nr:hypothetical protein [Candidatus Woesearchaeota archaeon]